MQTFHCDHWDRLVYCENVRREACGRALGYLTDKLRFVHEVVSG